MSLFIETHVREDHIHLYGFIDAAEREWFRLLTTVQGVGAKLALAILSVLSSGDLTQAILVQDKTSWRAPAGSARRLAVRIVTELKDKVGGIALGASRPWSGRHAAHAGRSRCGLGPASISAIAASRRSAPSRRRPSGCGRAPPLMC